MRFVSCTARVGGRFQNNFFFLQSLLECPSYDENEPKSMPPLSAITSLLCVHPHSAFVSVHLAFDVATGAHSHLLLLSQSPGRLVRTHERVGHFVVEQLWVQEGLRRNFPLVR